MEYIPIFLVLGALAVGALLLLMCAIGWLEKHLSMTPATIGLLLLVYIALHLH